MGKTIRRAIIPRPGRMLLEIDYSGVEVRVAQCSHKDPTMMTYINDTSKDMHRDMAIQIFKLDTDDWTKALRQTAKGKWVFAQFYGDWYGSCAEALWHDIDTFKLTTRAGVPLKQHLKSKGISSLDAFKEHCKEVENDFWNKRFKVFGKWRVDHVAAYQKRGHFDLLSGFRCKGVMKRNDCINYPTQGPAFHCLLWSFIKITDELEKGGYRSFPVAQIHDSIILDIEPSELNEVMEICNRIMCKDIHEAFPWLVVPLETEADLVPIGKSWYDKKAIVEGECDKCDCDWLWKWEDKETKVKHTECPMCGHHFTKAPQ